MDEQYENLKDIKLESAMVSQMAQKNKVEDYRAYKHMSINTKKQLTKARDKAWQDKSTNIQGHLGSTKTQEISKDHENEQERKEYFATSQHETVRKILKAFANRK